MMISPDDYRKELKNLTSEELSERKKELEKFINDYENNNLPQLAYFINPSPQTRYSLYKEYLDKVITEIGIRRHQSEMFGVKVSKSQCANCKNYLGDINCKTYGKIAFDILGNKKSCPDRKENNVETNKDVIIKIKQVNFGIISPFDYKSKEWNVFSDLNVELKIEQSGLEKSNENITTYDYKISTNQLNLILENIELAKSDNSVVNANDGEAWEFIKFENNKIVWKKDLGYIYGIKPLEKITEILNKIVNDESEHEHDCEKTIQVPVFSIIDLAKIAENIYNKIENLPAETEFTIQQFLKDYTVEEKDKFSICNSVFELCKNNNIVIAEKNPRADWGLSWNIPRIKKSNNNKELSNIIDKKLKEFDDNIANNLKNYILEIVEKIINLPNYYETTISKIINYNPESNSVDPLTQGIIYNKVNEICKEIKINLQSTYDDVGGLAFHFTFIKMKENEIYVKPRKNDDAEIKNINENEDIKKSEISYICYYDFVPYKQIGPIRLNVEDKENYEETGAPHINSKGINHALCKPLFIDSPAIVKRNKNRKDEVYIIYNGIKIKITSYYNSFIEELRKICDDIKLVEIPDESYTLVISEELGIIIRAEEIDSQFLIRFISFCGKEAFVNILKNNLN